MMALYLFVNPLPPNNLINAITSPEQAIFFKDYLKKADPSAAFLQIIVSGSEVVSSELIEKGGAA